MKYDEKTILTMARTILTQLGTISSSYKINKARLKTDDVPIAGALKGKATAIWTISIEDDTFGTTDFLLISDQTGEPLYVQSKHGLTEVEKVDGAYQWKT